MIYQNEYTLTVDIKKKGINQIPVFVKNDTAILNLRFLDDDMEYDISTADRYTVSFKKPSGGKVTGQGRYENGMLVYELGATEMEEIGMLEVIAQVYIGTTRISTRPFQVKILEDIENGIASQEQLTLLQELFIEVDNHGQYAKTQGDYAKAQGDNLGHKGNYSATVAYKDGNVVNFGGVNYICILDTTAGIDPTNGTYWTSISPQASINEQSWIATEGQTVFTITNGNYVVDQGNIEVWVGGVPQVSGVGYTETNNTTITLSEGVTAGTTVFAKWFEGHMSITKGHKSSHALGGQDEIDITQLRNFQEQVVSPLAETTDKLVESVTTFYVSTTGNDSNDGKTLNSAFATLQKAIDTISSAYLVIQSTIKVDIQTGTYTQTSSIPTKLRSKERIQFLGKVDANGIPTVIFDGNGLSGSGIFANENAFFSVHDIHFKNYRNAGGTACGVHAQHFANIWTKNVHITNCDWGISVSANSRLYVQGGVVDNCRFGIRHYSNCVGTIGYNSGSLALGTVVKNCTQAGVYFQNQSSGHVDYCTVDGNVSGVAMVNQSRAHIMGCDIKNNTQEGVFAYHQSTWMNDNNTFTNNAKKWRMTAFSSELSSHQNSRSLLQSYVDLAQTVHTGTTTNTQIKAGLTVKGGTFTEQGRKLKVVATGTFSGAGTKTVSFRTTSGILQDFTSVNGSAQAWKLEMDLYAVSPTEQKHATSFADGNVSYGQRYFTRNYDFNTDQQIRLWGQLSDVAGSITVETFEIQEVI